MTKVNLREERESRNISVTDVSRQAKIPIQFIEALETGIVPQKLRGPILLSYKKKYLKFLGLPQDAKLRFKTTKRQLPPSSRKGHSRTKTILTTTTNGITQPSTLQSMAIGFSIAVLCIVSLKLISTVLDSNAEAPPTEKVAQATTKTEKKEGSSSQMGGALHKSWLDSLFQKTGTIPEAQAAENSSSAEETEVVPEPEGSRLSVAAVEGAKVRVYCDSTLQYSGFLERGESNIQVCTFQQDASVWTEDISRVKVAFNNRYIRPMGPQDAARTLRFKR